MSGPLRVVVDELGAVVPVSVPTIGTGMIVDVIHGSDDITCCLVLAASKHRPAERRRSNGIRPAASVPAVALPGEPPST
jgi:hypothetical protein